MKKAQRSLNFPKISILLILVFLFSLFFNLPYLVFQIFVSRPITILLILTWFLVVLFSLKKEVFGVKVKKEMREKTFFYALFITFLIFYLLFFL
jgi:hypothetical protein